MTAMNLNTAIRGAVSGARRHPRWAAGICAAAVTASVVTGTTVASARPEPMLAVSAAEVKAAPAQHVLYFGKDPVKPVTDLKAGATIVKEPWNEDGCDHDYGLAYQCVPWTVPGSTAKAKCAWLESNGFGAIKVYGTNRQHLPENAQGYVCASGM
jgi:hypothetical protein